MDARKSESSKLVSICQELAKQSYNCLEKNPSDGAVVCKSHFDAYKECRKAEHTAIIEERRSKGARLS